MQPIQGPEQDYKHDFEKDIVSVIQVMGISFFRGLWKILLYHPLSFQIYSIQFTNEILELLDEGQLVPIVAHTF